jgi:hypothetical protein
METELIVVDPDREPSPPAPGPDYRVPAHGGGLLHRAGRPKGAINKSTQERRELCDMVFGSAGSEERKVFAQKMRERFLEGKLSAVVEQTLLHWWLGKPKDTVEVHVAPPDFSTMTNEELATRAQQLANEVLTLDGELVNTPSTPDRASS